MEHENLNTPHNPPLDKTAIMRSAFDITKKALEIIRNDDKSIDITEKTLLWKDLRLDDLSCIELCMDLEKTLNIGISDIELSKWETVGDVVMIVSRYCANGLHLHVC